jgi:hypothetical protein
MVQNNTGMTVDEAMRKALVFDSAALELPALAAAGPLDLESLKAVLSEALRDEIATPLIAEMQALRDEVAGLRESRQTDSPAPKIESPAESTDRQHGLLIRLLIRLEQRFRGG